jgi:hypothetical protein
MAKPEKEDQATTVGSRVLHSMRARRQKARRRDRVWDAILWPVDAIYYAGSVVALLAWVVWFVVSMPFKVLASLSN